MNPLEEVMALEEAAERWANQPAHYGKLVLKDKIVAI